MSFVGKNDIVEGYSIDLGERIAAGVGDKIGKDVKIVYVPVTSKDRFKALSEHKIDILCGATTKTVSRDEFVDFNGYRALKLTGLYGGGDANSWPRVYGGPFRSYTFFVPEDQRIYMIDYSMFAPNREKKYYLRKMDLMVHTFSVQKQSSN